MNLSARRLLEDKNLEEGEKDGQMDQALEGEEDVLMEGEEDLLGPKKRHSDPILGGKWSRDIRKVKRMKLDTQSGDGELDQGGKRGEVGGRKGGRRREREQLKEQLEEARERLKALQERVWRAFGEKHMEEEKEKGQEDGGDMGMVEEEDETGAAFDEDDIDGREMEKENFSLLSVSPFSSSVHKRREGRQKEKEGRRGRGRGGGGGGGLQLEEVMEGASLWLECGGLMRDDCYGMEEEEEEGEEGGQKFAQALKLELGSAVARVIDRVLRLYTEMADSAPSPHADGVSFLPAEPRGEGGREKDVWMGLLAMGREEDKARGKGDKLDGEREKQKMSNGSAPPVGQPRRSDPSDLPLPLAVQRSADVRKAHPLLAPPLSASLASSHPNLPLHPPTLPRPPPLSHPPLLPPASQPKDHLSTSSSLHPPSSSSSSSSSSYPPPPPPPPPPLPLPLLHYSMQQLFSRSLHHPQLPHLPPSRKDYLSSDPFLDFSSHPSFPPLPLLGHLDPSLARHPHGRERGMRGDGGIRGTMDGGELYLTAGGISFLKVKWI